MLKATNQLHILRYCSFTIDLRIPSYVYGRVCVKTCNNFRYNKDIENYLTLETLDKISLEFGET
jgi:hypothetical protein